MMHADVMNEFVLDNVSNSGTDWVLTFPTRHFFVTGAVGASAAATPFTNVLTTAGACEAFTFTFFNREEGTLVANDFSPFQTTSATTGSLCWESTVLSIRSRSADLASTTSLVLGSSNLSNVNIQSSGFQNGWASVHFAGANASTVGLLSDATSITSPFTPALAGFPLDIAGAQRFLGLPVMGFMMRTFQNGTATCGTATCQANYGGSVDHSYRNVITP